MLKTPKTALDAATDYPHSAPLKNDYDVANERSIDPEKRLRVITEMLKAKKPILLDAANRGSLHPAAIAAAITWEFVENVEGWLTDLVLPIDFWFQKGYGYGSFHKPTLRKFRPDLDEAQLNAIRTNLDSAIHMIAEYTGKRRDEFRRLSGGIDLSDWPAGLTWLFNTSDSYANGVGLRKAKVKPPEVPALEIQNDMAYWTERNLFRFTWLQPTSKLPASAVAYKRSVSSAPNVEMEALSQVPWP